MQVIKSILLILFVIIFSNANVFSQNETTKLFSNSDALSMKLSYSNKNMKRKTNDSTYIDTDLFYKSEDGSWVNFPVSLRARGNFRRATCYFPPIKMKIKKSNSNSTLFEGNKKLKLVLPCKIEKDLNDYKIMKKVGFSATPSDGIAEIKLVSDYVCKIKGGHGAFREFCDLILNYQK